MLIFLFKNIQKLQNKPLKTRMCSEFLKHKNKYVVVTTLLER